MRHSVARCTACLHGSQRRFREHRCTPQTALAVCQILLTIARKTAFLVAQRWGAPRRALRLPWLEWSKRSPLTWAVQVLMLRVWIGQALLCVEHPPCRASPLPVLPLMCTAWQQAADPFVEPQLMDSLLVQRARVPIPGPRVTVMVGHSR